MRKIERLALAAVLAWFLTGGPWLLNQVARVVTGEDLPLQLPDTALVQFYALRLICAGWLYVEAPAGRCGKWVWALFGLLFEWKGVAVFYGVAILHELRGLRNEPPAGADPEQGGPAQP
jgi:hypothetical protein